MSEGLEATLALEIARYFDRHLREELEKRPDLLAARRFDGLTAREALLQIRGRLLRAFPTLEDLPPAPYNLIEEWARRNRFIFAYADYAFDLYSRVFLERLLALHQPTPEQQQRFREVTLANFGAIDASREGFSISFFLRVENNMRELLREISSGVPGIDVDAAWRLIYRQSADYQELVNEVFERRLALALEETRRLLLNILPAAVVAELQREGQAAPTAIEAATVLFADLVGFTGLAERMSATALVRTLDDLFSRFDAIADEHGLEKIKTIGDAYMCAGGLPTPTHTHAVDVALAALKMRACMAECSDSRLQVRIGLHSGPLVAGVIGRKKFSYDIWGDTVNTASRLESSSAAGQINTSEASYRLLAPFFTFTPRGEIEAKSKGRLPMYFLGGIRPELADPGDPTAPGDAFRAAYAALRRGPR